MEILVDNIKKNIEKYDSIDRALAWNQIEWRLYVLEDMLSDEIMQDDLEQKINFDYHERKEYNPIERALAWNQIEWRLHVLEDWLSDDSEEQKAIIHEKIALNQRGQVHDQIVIRKKSKPL
jgi:hypothetical protein